MFKSTLVMVCSVLAAVAAGIVMLSLRYPDMALGEAPRSAPASSDAPITSVMSQTAQTAQTAQRAQTAQIAMTAIPKSKDGHFWVEAKVNQSAVRFLVDTGATVVALTPQDAQRLGIDLKTLDYTKAVGTASGPTKAAEVVLNHITIGSHDITGIKALVIKDGLATSLLGMSYLGRLSRIEATPNSLTLYP